MHRFVVRPRMPALTGAALLAGLGALLLAAATLLALPAGADDTPEVTRLAGQDRFATARAVAAATHPDGADTVYVATGTRFPDALASGPAATADGAPVLLVARDVLPAATADALDDLAPTSVVLLGGPAAISEGVAQAIADRTGATLDRVAGSTRFETAAALADRFDPGVPVAYIANGATFPDALAGGAAGGATGGPVLLVQRDSVPDATAEALERLAPESIAVLGGTGAVGATVAETLAELTATAVDRLGGADRFGTAVAVSTATFPSADTVYLARGTDFPDALAGGPAAGAQGAPVLLSPRTCLPEVVVDELERLRPDRVVLLGGPGALGSGVEALLICGRETSVVAEGLEVPWDVAFTPDDRVFVTERDSGRLLELVAGQANEVQTIPGVNAAGEGGLLGLAVSPGYVDDGLLYAYLSTADDNRVVRFRPGEDPEPVVTGIPHASIHNGGRIAFGPDGLLYVATGDAGVPELAQDPDSLAGKILRYTPDGGIPHDNPLEGSPVYALGLRNSQGLAWAGDGTFYATDFGPECDDLVNEVVPGGNYGWPDPCSQTRPGALEPLIVKQPPEASWSGAGVLVGGALPAWEGDLFVAALRGQRLWRFAIADDGTVAREQQLLVGEYGRLRHVTQAPDGSLWILTSNRDGRGSPVAADDRIIRIGPPR